LRITHLSTCKSPTYFSILESKDYFVEKLHEKGGVLNEKSTFVFSNFR